MAAAQEVTARELRSPAGKLPAPMQLVGDVTYRWSQIASVPW